ncbi:MAG: hypothetical protein CEN87_19 [Parcubacteria group bacterium Licking1014_1]|nr:MAG: hypothetical protein CEN87_19 [Parcubacteria group bacterium Licking1014_1]
MDESPQITNKNLLEADLCYKIQGAIFNVVNKYGKGFKENIYQKALVEEFIKQNISFEQQKRINIYSLDTGKPLGVYIPDFIIDNKVVLEIKASNFTTKQDISQQRSYLRASTYEIGYLVNFNSSELDIQRSIYTNDRKPFMAILQKT